MAKIQRIAIFIFISLLIISNCSQNNNTNRLDQNEYIPEIEKNNMNEKNIDDIKFDSELWKKSDYRERSKYINDIIKNNKLMTLTKEEVIKMLGAPDKVFKEEEDIYLYKVDLGRKLNEGTPILHFLSIEFDNTGLSKNVYVTD